MRVLPALTRLCVDMDRLWTPASVLAVFLTLSISIPVGAATKTWAANGVDDNWSTASNWSPVGAPVAGDDLVFSGLSSKLSSENDLAPNTSFSSITIVLSHFLSGNAIVLTGGMTHTTTANTIITFPIVLSGGFPLQIQHNIDVANGTLTLSGTISGCSSGFAFCSLRKIGAGTLVLDEPNTYGGPTRIDAGTLDMKVASALGATSAGTLVAAGATLEVSINAPISEPLTLSGSGTDGAGALKFTAALNSIATPVTLAADAAIGCLGDLTVSSAIDGAGGLFKAGAGTLQLGGSASNTYAGTTTVNEGTLALNKMGGAIAVAGPLVIGDGVGGNGADVVRLFASEQIANHVLLTVNSSGLFDLRNFNHTETIHSLAMTHGTISGSAATLVLGGDVTVTQLDPSSAATISVSTLSLGGATRTFTVVGPIGSVLEVSSAIVDGGTSSGLVKSGVAWMQLSGSNAYSGPTTIAAGRLIVSAFLSPLGSPAAGTTIVSGAALDLRSIGIAHEPLVVDHAGSLLSSGATSSQYSGPIVTLGTMDIVLAQPLNIAGPITGPGSLRQSNSLLTLSAVNTYQGATTVLSGTLRVNGSGAIPDTSSVDVSAGAIFDLTAQIETVGALSGAGAVTLGTGKVTVGANSLPSTFSGTLTGNGVFGGLVKVGTGTFTFSGTATLTGGSGTQVEQGTLIVTGSMASYVAVVNGILGGTGHVGSVVAYNGGALSPGLSAGTLTIDGDLGAADESVFVFELNAASTGNASDRLVVTGIVDVGNAELSVTIEGTPAPGEVFTILQNDGSEPIGAGFSGLDFAGRLHVGDVELQVSYEGGDGNDITLTAVVFTHYLAEGATSDFFDMHIALLNPSATTAANVNLRFMKLDGSIVTSSLTMPPLSRRTVNPKTIVGLEAAEFSTVVESSVPLVVDRTMTWDSNHYGSHTETSVSAPAAKWYLAEGATHSGFNLFYLIQNANPTPVNVAVTYLRPTPNPPLVKNYVVGANSRFNIWVNLEGPELAATDVSAVIDSTEPVIVERAMYLNSAGLYFGAGHESAGVTAPADSWYLAEGATGPYFDLFVLIANPSGTDAQIMARYFLPDGTFVEKEYTVVANSRFNIWVDLEGPQLANTAVSTRIQSVNDVPIIVERAMWWPGGATTWAEAHNSAGATLTGTRWGLAEGEQGGPSEIETYILLANPFPGEALVDVTLYFEDDTSAVRTYTVAPRSRFNVQVGTEFPEAAGRKFGAIVQSTGSPARFIVVERAMYSDANGVIWAAGTNALGTRLQ